MPKKKSKNKKTKKTINWHMPESIRLNQEPSVEGDFLPLMHRFVKAEAAKKTRTSKHSYDALLDAEVHSLQNTYPKMYVHYMNKLDALSQYKTMSELEKLDRIDITNSDFNMQTPMNVGDAVWEYVSSLPNVIYGVIPCYKEGLLCINEERRAYFCIKDFNEDTGAFLLELRLYQFETDINRWTIGIGGTLQINSANLMKDPVTGDRQIMENVSVIAEETFADLYTKISPRNLGWNEQQCHIWQEITIQNAVNQYQLVKDQGQDTMQNAILVFGGAMMLVNYMLSNKRPTVVREPKPRDDIRHNRNDKPIQPADTPRVRILGPVKFISPHPPIKVSRNTVRKYMLSEWTVKGHMRHYKNGKVIYIKPTIHRRKSLNSESVTAQNIIKVKT